MAEIARGQHGVISALQLMNTGLSTSAVSRRVAIGRLHRIHRGVYAVGHAALSAEARWMAAVLACGRSGTESGAVLDYWGAALSHRSAAELWALLPARDGLIDVSIPGDGGKKRRKGIRLHRSLTLLPAAVTLRNGIPVTTPARTIADLRRTVAVSGKQGLISPQELRRAIRQANVLGLPVGDEAKRDQTRSDLERDFLRLCHRHHLPIPEVNVRIGPHLVDFLWRERMLVVETDGYGYHSGRVAFEDDRTRDLDLRGLGYDVLRLADRQITREPGRIADVIQVRLANFSSNERETRHPAP